ncbi:MAG: HPP family protein [Bilophila sp.]
MLTPLTPTPSRQAPSAQHGTTRHHDKRFFRIPAKLKGQTPSPPRADWSEMVCAWIGGFVGIAAVAFLHFRVLDTVGLQLITGSFGSSAVLLFGAIKSPLAQPRNLLGGHLLSALVGVVCYQLVGDIPWLASSLAVATAIVLMQITKTLHPPGGATALIAVIGGDSVHQLGFLFVLAPVTIGAVVMLAVALVVNNIPRNRQYPTFWW